MEDFRISKVEILIQQNKYTEAQKILSDLLTEEPNNIQYLSLMAQVFLRQDKYDNAISILDNAIGISPDEPHLFYMKSLVNLEQDNLKEAEIYINEAIEIDPYDADYFALLANIKLRRKQLEEALEMTSRALEIDAENLLALNTRSTVLNKLNRKEESYEAIVGALREDPNNSYTHANYGWGLLEKGNHKKALEHFKESLTNNPNNEYAQSGMLEAIKASNPIYRLYLKYTFFMSNLTSKYQWGVIIGFYFGFRMLRTIASNNENLKPYLVPIIVILAIIAFSTWIMNPISNLFLRFNKYGQLLLDKKEKMSSNFVAISLGVCVVGFLLYFIFSDERMLTIAIYGFAMMLSLGIMFSPTKNKNVLLIYTISLAIAGLISIGITFIDGNMYNIMTIIFIFGFVAFQWFANYILIKEDN